MLKRIALAAVAAIVAAAFWWRKNPSACPYSQRFWVEAPHPLITRDRLRDILDPEAGERILEIGPGTGYYTLDMAEWVSPGGTVEIFDIQQGTRNGSNSNVPLMRMVVEKLDPEDIINITAYLASLPVSRGGEQLVKR